MTTDVLIAGGGPAGCAAAIQLARAGLQVVLLERERTPTHKVCGEFLSGEALIYLQQLGIDLGALGAVPLDQVRLTGPKAIVERALPFPAMSLTRKCLDTELLRSAERAGAQVHRGCNVEHLSRAGDIRRVTLAGGVELTARAVFVASGKHDLRGHARPPGRQPGMVALKMYWRLRPAELHSLGSAVELITYPGGYAGLQPVEDGVANLCCLIQKDMFLTLGGRWDTLLAHMQQSSPHLRQRLSEAEAQLQKPLTISSLPYGFVRTTTDGVWYLGDQAAVIPSFTGDGMSLALHTGLLAVEMYLAGGTANAFQKTLAAQLGRQVSFATVVSRAMVRLPRASVSIARLWPGAITSIAKQTRLRAAIQFE